MIPWLQAQAAGYRPGFIDTVITADGLPMPLGLHMTRKDALDAAQALLQAVANESGVDVKISATPIPEILRCPNKVA